MQQSEGPSDYMEIKELVQLAVDKDASDIHLVYGQPPTFRINGELMPIEAPVLKDADLQKLIYSVLTLRQKEIFLDTQEVDCSFDFIEDYYSRVNIHVDKGHMACTIRMMPTEIKSAQNLRLPSAVDELALKRKGLILIVGPANTGKTTTMNYMINTINSNRRCKIITVEDPIEYIHQSKKSLIIQREVGSDTQSFSQALKYCLRQDPDVVAIGEMRDLESISMGLTTAETGHLVLTTLHAPDAIEAINRIIDVYPAEKQNQIRIQIAENLLAVIAQNLLPQKNKQQRILATEVLVATLPIRNMIRRGALIEIRGMMQTKNSIGMYTFEQCLSHMAKRNLITPATAVDYAKYPTLLDV